MVDDTNTEMTFHLSVDLGAVTGDPQEELSRILRYWAGNLKHYPINEPHRETHPGRAC